MSDKRLGRQTPTTSVILPYSESRGTEATAVYNRSGRTAQPWQQLMLEDIMAVNDDGLWVHMKFGWSLPRRNGKSELLIMRAMYGVSNGERVLYTAHRTTTSHNAWEKVIERLAKAGYVEGEDFKTTKQFGLERIEWLKGEGIFDKLIANMDELNRRGLIFGASVTVTTQNYREVCSDSFLDELSKRGCKAVIFVEYVPVTEESKELAPEDQEREYLTEQIKRLRVERPDMVYISFPGDEKSSGGCVAAGRGFFHINSHGGAEPCPFSPYSDVNVKNSSLREALHSPLFTALQSGDILLDDHEGGCVLYEKRALVEALINQ